MKAFSILAGVAALAISAGAIAQQAPAAHDAAHDATHDMGKMREMTGKPMTRAAADAHAREMFAKLDVNKDGRIDKADRQQDREARKAKHFAMLDKDGNGSISKDEFMAAAPGDGMKGKHGSMAMRGEGGPKAGAMQGMDMGAGKRGEGHHGKGRHGGGMGMMGPMILRMADADKDGSVTQAEFLAAHAKHFDMVDANHDGTVSPDERRAAMAKMRDHMREMRGPRGGPNGGQDPAEGHDHPAGA